MNQRFKKKLRRLRDLYCYIDFFLGQGLSVYNSLYQIVKYTAFAGIIVEMLNRAFRWNISMENVIYFTPVFIIILILTGIISTKKLHIIQKQNEISLHYNPKLVNLIEKNKI